MYSPIPGFMAEINLRPIENLIIKKFELKCALWIRYVGDVFIVWEHGTQPLKEFVVKVNEIDTNIVFTLEIENEGVLPYLYTELIKITDERKINRRVYWKHCRSNNTISYDSNSPFKYKLVAYVCYLKRAFDICSKKYLQNEINTVKQIAIDNGSPPENESINL